MAAVLQSNPPPPSSSSEPNGHCAHERDISVCACLGISQFKEQFWFAPVDVDDDLPITALVLNVTLRITWRAIHFMSIHHRSARCSHREIL